MSDGTTAEDAVPRVAGQCRFCLHEESAAVLVAPCGCEGTAVAVHPTCLVRWQQARPDRAACEVCRQPWRLPLPPTLRKCWVRNMETNLRYQHTDAGTVTAELRVRLLQRMRVGTLIVQTPRRAAEAEGAPAASQRDIVGMLLAMRQSMHWLRGVFVIVHHGHGDAADGSDTLVALNLTRAESALQRPQAPALRGATVRELKGGPC